MSSPTDRDYEIAGELLDVIRQLPAGAVSPGRPCAPWFDELAARVSAIRAERYAAGETDASTREKVAAVAEDAERRERFVLSAMQGKMATMLPPASLVVWAEEIFAEWKKRKS